VNTLGSFPAMSRPTDTQIRIMLCDLLAHIDWDDESKSGLIERARAMIQQLRPKRT
jgi:hypothetical protein